MFPHTPKCQAMVSLKLNTIKSQQQEIQEQRFSIFFENKNRKLKKRIIVQLKANGKANSKVEILQ